MQSPSEGFQPLISCIAGAFGAWVVYGSHLLVSWDFLVWEAVVVSLAFARIPHLVVVSYRQMGILIYNAISGIQDPIFITVLASSICLTCLLLAYLTGYQGDDSM